MKKKIFLGLLVLVELFAITWCGKNEAKKYEAGDVIEYNGIEVILDSKYKYEKGCAAKFDDDGCYTVSIPVIVKNNNKNTYNLEDKGPYFEIYTPSGIETEAYNNGYLDTNGQIKLRSNATLKDTIKESGTYIFAIEDTKIEIDYDINIAELNEDNK